ncbi:MAG TPA: DUF2891 family protein [Kofleriaceae bacterium]|nr:DUF2891 family protein [Kofleriaceae bacterium]
MTIAPRAALSEAEATRYARLALACVHRAYPYQVAHQLDDDGDVATPRRAHPVFWGCYDWHSAVHGHWTIAAVARRFPDAPIAADARAALARSFTAEAIAGEAAYLARRPAFERPYGLAWLCALHAELAAWPDDDVAAWAALLKPLAAQAAARIVAWLERLTHPTRAGTHAQSAFATSLLLDAARLRGDADADLARRAIAASRRLHAHDSGPALHLEPSGEDFLSPALGTAALMARLLAPDELAAWLARALPELDDDEALRALAPPVPADRTDGRLVHLDGLCASRATMLAAIARALPDDDRRRRAIDRCADDHARAALAALASQRYEGAHWLATFALAMRLSMS